MNPMSCADLIVRQGDDVEFSVTVTTDGTTPFDLDQVSDITCMISPEHDCDSVQVPLTLRVGTGVSIQTPTSAGIFDVYLHHAQTDTMAVGRQWMEIRLTLDDGTITTTLEASVEVRPQLAAVE